MHAAKAILYINTAREKLSASIIETKPILIQELIEYDRWVYLLLTINNKSKQNNTCYICCLTKPFHKYPIIKYEQSHENIKTQNMSFGRTVWFNANCSIFL